jgi:transketolase
LSAASGVKKGGYVLSEPDGDPQAILIGTGSEVHIALEAAKILAKRDISARVVSTPSWEIFDAQPVEYRHYVLPPQLSVRVSIEAASPLGWEHYVGAEGVAIGVSHFGASAPGEIVYEKMGLTAQNVADQAMRILQRK